jgi:hypothetical protein
MQVSLPIEQVTCDLDELWTFEVFQQEFGDDRPEKYDNLL